LRKTNLFFVSRKGAKVRRDEEIFAVNILHFVILNLFQDNKPPQPVILKHFKDSEKSVMETKSIGRETLCK
jgi:hypothetical protein